MSELRDDGMIATNSRGESVRRPLSPHLQVYRWPLSMALSILHRVTGVALGVGMLLLTWWLVAAATTDHAFDTVMWFIASPVGLLLLFGWTLALMFHLFAGLRHLVWDAGYGYELTASNASGWAVVIATGVSTVLLWVVGLAIYS